MKDGLRVTLLSGRFPLGVGDLVHSSLGVFPGPGGAATEQRTAAADFPAPQVRRDGIDRDLVHDCTPPVRRIREVGSSVSWIVHRAPALMLLPTPKSGGRADEASFVACPRKAAMNSDLRIGWAETGRESEESASGRVATGGHMRQWAGATRAGRCRASSSSTATWSASSPGGPRPPSGRPPPSRFRGGRRGCAPARRRPG